MEFRDDDTIPYYEWLFKRNGITPIRTRFKPHITIYNPQEGGYDGAWNKLANFTFNDTLRISPEVYDSGGYYALPVWSETREKLRIQANYLYRFHCKHNIELYTPFYPEFNGHISLFRIDK